MGEAQERGYIATTSSQMASLAGYHHNYTAEAMQLLLVTTCNMLSTRRPYIAISPGLASFPGLTHPQFVLTIVIRSWILHFCVLLSAVLYMQFAFKKMRSWSCHIQAPCVDVCMLPEHCFWKRMDIELKSSVLSTQGQCMEQSLPQKVQTRSVQQRQLDDTNCRVIGYHGCELQQLHHVMQELMLQWLVALAAIIQLLSQHHLFFEDLAANQVTHSNVILPQQQGSCSYSAYQSNVILPQHATGLMQFSSYQCHHNYGNRAQTVYHEDVCIILQLERGQVLPNCL